MNQREAFEVWWDDFQAAHEDWKFADRKALLFGAWQAAVEALTKPAHIDHPMRHYDRTCPACNESAQEAEMKNLDQIATEIAKEDGFDPDPIEFPKVVRHIIEALGKQEPHHFLCKGEIVYAKYGSPCETCVLYYAAPVITEPFIDRDGEYLPPESDSLKLGKAWTKGLAQIGKPVITAAVPEGLNLVGWLDGRGRFFYANDPMYKNRHDGMRECYAAAPEVTK